MSFELQGETIADRIRELFAECGNGESLRRFTQRCIELGLFDAVQMEGFMHSGASKYIKDVLRKTGEDGLRFAYNVTKRNGDEGTWKQAELMTYEDAVFVLQANYLDKVTATHAEMVNFQNWMRRRFGSAPSVPALTY